MYPSGHEGICRINQDLYQNILLSGNQVLLLKPQGAHFTHFAWEADVVDLASQSKVTINLEPVLACMADMEDNLQPLLKS